jgi:acetylornithine deacetylase/succinyl-diaminopimelate desuccinylase-like protein
MNESGLIQFAQDLVRIPSLSGQENELNKRVIQEMTKLGFNRVWLDPL